MSTVDLMILGHLLNSPRNAYEMKKELEAQQIYDWVKISTPSIYKNLIKLHNNGFLDAETVTEGEMPEKTIYTINEKGINYFLDLMEKNSQDIGKLYFEFNAVVANLKRLDGTKRKQIICNLQQQFLLKKIYFEKFIENSDAIPPIGISIICLYKDMFKLLYDWSLKLDQEYLFDVE